VAILTILSLSATADAGSRWRGPALDTLGVHLIGCSFAEGPATLPASLWPPAYREVSDRPDLVWVSFALLHDRTVEWPRGLVPVLYAPGRQVPARMFAVGGEPPRLRPVPLTRLDPGELWRKRRPCVRGQLCSVLFVGYPRGKWDPDSAVTVRLEPAR